MACSILAGEVSDLCIGKMSLRSLPTTATVADAVSILKRSSEINIGVWSCNHSDSTVVGNAVASCRCIRKISMVDVIVYLCKDNNLSRPFEALQMNVMDLVPEVKGQIRHLASNSCLLEAIDYILEGAQNLVIPIQPTTTSSSSLLRENGKEFCWLTPEDFLRFLLNSISIFSPIPTFTIESLNIIHTKTLTIRYDDPASSALPLITRSQLNLTSIAIINQDDTLIGEISPFSLSCCDEAFASAVATLSAGDLMAYMDYNGPPEDLVHLVKTRMQERNLVEDVRCSSYSSSDDEFGCVARSYPGRWLEPIVCYPWNTLMAVMVQMVAHRVCYTWVVKEDYGLVGIVRVKEIFKQFRSMQ